MKSTTDLWFASWLVAQEIPLADFEKLGKHKGSYAFKMTDEEWKQERLMFMASPLSKIKQLQEELKDLLY